MKSIRFLVATDSSYYGMDTGTEDVQEYATFAYEYLLRNGYEHVEIEFVERYTSDAAESQEGLREEIWAAYSRKLTDGARSGHPVRLRQDAQSV